MSADSPRRSSGSRGSSMPSVVPPQVVSDRSIIDSAIGFINDVTLAHQPHTDPKDTITWARFESAADISDPRYGDDWELEGNVAPPLLLILGYGLGVQVWAIPANGEAVEVLSWRHGIVSALRVLPTPTPPASAMEEHVRADELVDAYAEKRPLIAMVDGSTSVGAQPQFSAVNFVSLKTGTQVKTIKFKNPVLDILANRSSIAVTFHERIAVFDARTLEDRLSVTTCFPSPGINPNPVALGPRWLAYAEHKLLHSKRSGGGCDGEGVASYTATVLNAAKSLGKGLRELGEQVAAGLAGSTVSGANSKNNSFDSGMGPDAKQPGVVTIIDTKHPIKDYSPTSGTPLSGHAGSDPIVAHFAAHSEAVVALEFDNTGLLLVTADRRGHDFHIFRVQPHPVGSSLAAVHHLYVLHRGDTSAKVQNIAFSLDSRWVAVSTLRGTTHVFPITPYGGPMGVRTHTSLHVVNKLSRFHRSAGLSADGRSSSPISHSESTTFVQSLQPFHNPTLPPFSRPTVVLPLAQLRQPLALGSPPGSAPMSAGGKAGGGAGGGGGGAGSSASQRQRLSSLSDDSGKPLSVCAIFAKSRSWLLEPPNATREAPHRIQRKAVDSLFVMAGHGALIQYDLDTKLASNVAKEKICDDTPIELEVEAKAQWNLGRRKDGSQELMPPLGSDNWLIRDRNSCMLTDSTRHYDDADDRAESWLSQVEIITHAGPHRRLWMGPQFVFKTYNAPSGSNLNHVDAEAVEIGVSKPSSAAAAAVAATRGERSSPLNMPLTATAHRSAVPVLIESGSYSSIEQSPKLMDRFRHGHLDSDFSVAHGDSRLKEDLADAMRESPSVSAARKDTGRLPSDAASSDNVPFYDALAEHEHENDEDDQAFASYRFSAAAALASALPNIYSYDVGSSYESFDSFRKPKASIEKIVNPLGTVTTVTAGMSTDVQTDILDEVVSQLAAEDCVIHENCDESLFRPVVAIFCDANTRPLNEEEKRKEQELCKPPELVGNKLIVPVIDKDVDDQLCKREKQKNESKSRKQQQQQQQQKRIAEAGQAEELSRFVELSKLNKNPRCKSTTKDAVSFVRKENCPKVGKEKDDGKKSTNDDADFEILLEQEVVREAVGIKEAISRKPLVPEVQKEKSTIPTRSVVVTPFEGKKMNAEQEDKNVIPKRVTERARKSEEKETKRSKEIVRENNLAEKDGGGKEAAKEVTKSPKVIVKLAEEEKPMEFMRMTPLPVEKSKKQTADKSNSSANEITAAATNEPTSMAAKTLITESKISTNIAKDKKLKTVSEKCPMPVGIEEQSGGKDGTSKSSKPQKGDVEDVKNKSDCKNKADAVKLPEPVELYRAPKLSKKNKKKQNKSGSNSESEEVVEVVPAKIPTGKRKSIDIDSNQDETPKDSSEEGSIDLADSLLENKPNMQDTMYVSCTQKDIADDTSNTDQKEAPVKSTNRHIIVGKELTASDCSKTKNDPQKDIAHLPRKEGAVEKEMVAEKVSSVNENKCEEKIKKEVLPIVNDNARKGKMNLRNTEKTEPSEVIIVQEHYPVDDDKNSEKQKGIGPKRESVGKKEVKKVEKINAEPAISFESETLEEVIVRNEPSKVKAVAKSDEKPAGPEQKAPKKNQTEVVKCETDKMPPPSNTNTTTKKKIGAQFDDVSVITEQPTKAKPATSVDTKAPSSKEETTLSKRVEARKADEIIKAATYQSNNSSVTSKKTIEAEGPAATSMKLKTMSPPVQAAPSVWQSLANADKGAKHAETLKAQVVEDHYPSLSKVGKNKKNTKQAEALGIEVAEKLIPEIPTPNKASPPDAKEPLIGSGRNSKNPKKILPFIFDDFPQIKSLPSLPPLPSLESLDIMPVEGSRTKDAKDRPKNLREALVDQVSLINFESPLQENPALERKITPPPRGFTEQNLIFALCGSLHYENENGRSTLEKSELPTVSVEVDDYEDLEKGVYESKAPSSTREKVMSSPNSSASEEIIVLEEKKMSKKQKRKQQQIELELQQRKTDATTNDDEVDEELRPLITLSDSHLENFVDTMAASDHFAASFPAISARSADIVLEKSFSLKPAAFSSLFSHPTGTSAISADGDGAQVKSAKVVDEKLFTLSSGGTPVHSSKNKKLEYKINLIAGVEAATSSSTSSAEESGVEASGRLSDLDGALVSVSATASAPHPLPPTASTAAENCATKKKTKRRKR